MKIYLFIYFLKSQVFNTIGPLSTKIQIKFRWRILEIAKIKWFLIIFSYLPGQIAANEALKKDLEGIISGLQDYLHGVKDQARQAQSDCLRLQKEKDTLQQLLWDKDQQLSQLLQVAEICEKTKEV